MCAVDTAIRALGSQFLLTLRSGERCPALFSSRATSLRVCCSLERKFRSLHSGIADEGLFLEGCGSSFFCGHTVLDVVCGVTKLHPCEGVLSLIFVVRRERSKRVFFSSLQIFCGHVRVTTHWRSRQCACGVRCHHLRALPSHSVDEVFWQHRFGPVGVRSRAVCWSHDLGPLRVLSRLTSSAVCILEVVSAEL